MESDNRDSTYIIRNNKDNCIDTNICITIVGNKLDKVIQVYRLFIIKLKKNSNKK